MTHLFDSADAVAAAIIERVGRHIVLGLPVGVGKAVHVANALYARAAQDSSIRLTIFTALTLEVPRARSPLERRFLEPFAQRLYGDWPELDYARAVREQALPPNIEVREFYFRPGGYLGNGTAQRSYTSLNYTQVARELLHMGVNVIAQLVAVNDAERRAYSLGSNPEVTLDLLPELERRRAAGTPVAMVGQVNSQMPYMVGAAELPAERLDFVLESPALDFPLFGLPNRKVKPADYAAGMHVASLVPDGGTLQLGIGSLSTAVAHCLIVRQREPELFRTVLEQLPGGTASACRPDLPAHTTPFRAGLYVVTELLADALFALYQAGIVRRPAGEGDDTLMHAGFMLGSQALYAGLRNLPEAQRRSIEMTAISFVNSLHGNETIKRHQRRNACFINEAMMVTLLGAAVSDSLEDGRIVSGVGGQFDFVRMAHALDGARSIVTLNSSRLHNGVMQSNLRWQYPHTTVPRHYRDVYATEYGLAATRGLSDAAVIGALLNIADSRFQPELLEAARRAGKIAADYSLPADVADNRAETLQRLFAQPEWQAHFPPYPLGTDLTPVEQQLADALGWLEQHTARRSSRWRTLMSAISHSPVAADQPALQRMQLDHPSGAREWLEQRLVARALTATR